MKNLTPLRVDDAQEFFNPPPAILTLKDETDQLIRTNSKHTSLYLRYPLVIDFINNYKVFYVSELKELLNLEEIPISNRLLSVLLKALVFDGLLVVKCLKSGFHKKRQVYWLKGSEEEANKQIVFFERQLENYSEKCEHEVKASICAHCRLEQELGTKLSLNQFHEINESRGREEMITYGKKYNIRV